MSSVAHSDSNAEPIQHYKFRIDWINTIRFGLIHIGAFIGLYFLFTAAQWKTILWSYLLAQVSMLGVTAGAHRLWTHRAFKAKLPLRIILAILQTIAYQDDIHEWARDHRVHHKYTDTDADPHNARRGFFFSHMGGMLFKKHKDAMEKCKTIDLSDVLADPVVRFQKKYYPIITPIFGFILPAWVAWYFWNENEYVAMFVASLLRFTFSLHSACLVNSAAHMWGTRPYDKSILSTENLFVSLMTVGEGWHNYHHVYPWDYKASELGTYSTNLSTAFIDLMAKIGWAYELKSASEEMIKKRVARTGDLSFLNNPAQQNPDEIVWGSNDKNMKSDAKDLVNIQYSIKQG